MRDERLSPYWDLHYRLQEAARELGGVQIHALYHRKGPPWPARVIPNHVMTEREAPIAFQLAGVWRDARTLLRVIRRYLEEP